MSFARSVLPLLLAATAGMVAVAGCGQVQHHQSVGGLDVALPWARAVPPGAPVAAGYLTIRNRGTHQDRLVSVRTSSAERVEIHAMRMEDGVARMRALADGLPIPPGATVSVAPGGYHLMFITPGTAFTAGGEAQVTLVFAEAGELQVVFEVRPMGDIAAPAGAHH
ncbi:MAG TPA: copper chaperone PCu(A)C [Luteimonas sp.]|nr:copper chaperone PCu(A)C [Luteimonas sp.]